MTKEELIKIIETFGADPQKWPKGSEEQIALLLKEDLLVQKALQSAQKIDKFLDTYQIAEPSLTLKENILGNLNNHPPALFQKSTLWPKVTFLALCAGIGFVLGNKLNTVNEHELMFSQMVQVADDEEDMP